jgi:linoleoyl-CoA desaturase
MPSNRYPTVAPKVRETCERYDLRDTSGSLPRQYAQVVRSALRLTLSGDAS